MSKGLLTHVLVLLPVKKNFVFMLKNAIKKNLRKSEKTKSLTSLPLFQKYFHTKKYVKKISKNKLY